MVLLVMDGITIGGRKDLLPPIEAAAVPDQKVAGSTIEQRLFIRVERPRILMAKYANLSKGSSRYSNEIASLPDLEFGELLESLSCKPSLQEVVRQGGNPCPKSLQKLVGELSRETATCAMLQVTGDTNTEAYNILTQLVNGDVTQFIPTVENHVELFRKSCPLILEFLLSEDIEMPSTKIDLLKDVLKSVDAPFVDVEIPGEDMYGPVPQSDPVLSFFPNFPLLCGRANYKADSSEEKQGHNCRKQLKTTPIINPGVFTLFCPHGSTYGLEVMKNAESPHHPFEIFVQRFRRIPRYLVYDNSSKLHLYALKREPKRFQNTRFLVDRLHYPRGHVACTLGYSMDSYSNDEYIKNINSQVNEQANSELRRLSTSCAYMSPKNVLLHMKAFLAIRNILKDFK